MRWMLATALAVTLVLQTGCAFQPSIVAAPATTELEASRAITQVSQACADAWNRGDLKAYLTAYADDVVIVYDSGPEKGTGLLKTRLRQSQRWDGTRPNNQARVGHSEVVLLDPAHAVQTAEIIIQEPNQEAHLWITSVLRRTDRGWIVIHEQSF